MNVSILSIGTELTTGQIINRNSAWISTRLKTYGVDPQAHLCVPDDKKLILEALGFCAQHSEVLFITGGLGPTSDDFTRDVVAEWLQLKLIFNEESWAHIQEVLTQRSVTVKAIQKQQCYFPENAQILYNSKGTANGFQIEKGVNGKLMHIFVLPGPPLEIEAIWNDHIVQWLQHKTRNIDKVVTHSWDTLGHPESEVATMTESALTDLKKDFPLTVGYRVHLPYVEVKASYPQSAEFTASLYVQKIEKALAPITVLRNFENAASIFSQLIGSTSFAFYDFCTQGSLHQTLAPHLKKHSDWLWKQSNESMDSDFFTEEENFLALFSGDDKSCTVMANFNGKNMTAQIEVPARFLTLTERKFQYFTEMALIQFIKTFPNT